MHTPHGPAAVTRLTRALLAAVAAALLVVVGPVLTAHAEGQADTITYEGRIAADGTLTVSQTLAFAAGATPASITQRLALTAPGPDNSTYHYTITGAKATTADGTDLGATITTDDDYQVITLDSSKAANQPIVISYSVTGATHPAVVPAGQPAGTTVSWRFLQGLSVSATTVTGELLVPVLPSDIDCVAGPPTAPSECVISQMGTHDSPNPSFEDGPRGEGEVVVLSVQVPTSAVAVTENVTYDWTLDRAFSVSRLSLLLGLGTLLVGAAALFLMHRRNGRDAAALNHPTRIAEFSPTGDGEEEFVLLEDIRPGQVGTVADERVDPVDVTGTLLDLSVHGHLRIVELPRESPHHPLDWTFERRDAGTRELRPYEVLLRDAVAPEGGDAVKVSSISMAIADVIPDVQAKLYDDVVSHGWFDKRPDDARNNWNTFGWVALSLAVVVAGLLVAFTTLGLWGLALVAVALGLVFVAQEMPRRSAKGAELLAGLQVLSNELQHHRTDRMPPAKVYSELSEILPYAVVLGGSERWLQALADSDDDDDADGTELEWYHAPDTWHLAHLPVSMKAFITSVEGHLFGR